MRIFKKANAVSDFIRKMKSAGKSIGFVPTMGALHEGHLSLLNIAKKETDFTVASIFVNPTQFNNKRDYEKYPISIEEDIDLLENMRCDLLFIPPVEEIYPGKKLTTTHYDLGFLESVYEGHYRPGHFQGVCQVVDRLLNICIPDKLFLGQKDYQQCLVIQKLLDITDKQDAVSIVVCPTLRENNGLAMSSRNRRLNASEKNIAANIYRILDNLKQNLNKSNQEKIVMNSKNELAALGFKIDYLDIVKANSLEPAVQWNDEEKLVALVAVHLDEIRLIDNLALN